MSPRALLAWVCAGLTGCATIEATSQIQVRPNPSAPTLHLAKAQRVRGGTASARWVQLGGELVVELEEWAMCSPVVHTPVVRVETIDRRAAHGGLWWEFGIAAGVGTVAALAFINPESFSSALINPETGQVIRPKEPGYIAGGIFGSIATMALIGGIVDSTRVVDEVIYADAYVVEELEAERCGDGPRPVARHAVALVVGEYRTEGVTDLEGRVRLRLPPESDRRDDHLRVGAVVLDGSRAVSVDFREPYDLARPRGHTGVTNR